MIDRRRFLSTCTSAFALSGIGMTFSVRPLLAQDIDLTFDPEGFETKEIVIGTASGDVTVSYHFWRAISYVARPVDRDYQTLNVSVPVAINGVATDASTAPILFANSVGGYFPSFVGEADGVGGGGMAGPGGAMPAGLQKPPAPTPGAAAPSGSAAMMAGGKKISNAQLALAAGLVVVEPGTRGRTLIDANGVYFGVAPAVIVDLKAAVRYVRFNAGRIPGNTERIVSSGTSAGGAVSALLGASGDSPLYASALSELGAAEASDAIFATGAWCPITDLENADGAYEWCWGPNATEDGARVDAALSDTLADSFAPYQASLKLVGDNNEALTANTYGAYLVETLLKPEATAYLAALSEADRTAYLAQHANIGWTDGSAQFDWTGFVAHVGTRKKTLPAFDGFDLTTGENNLFGLGTTKARHFTLFSLRHASGDPTAELDADIAEKLFQMNPMAHLAAANAGRSRHWWLRTGASDTDTSLTIVANLAAIARGLGDDVNLRLYWDAGHGANEDAAGFLDWIKTISV